MDINILRGIIVLLLIVGFLGLWVWAWSKRRKETFRRMSMLPLEEDDGRVPDQADETGKGENDVK